MSDLEGNHPARHTGHICVIGAGAWGSALAQAAALAGNVVYLLGRDEGVAREINNNHSNQRYLGNQGLSERIRGTTDFSQLGDADLVMLAVPAQQTRNALAGIPPHLKGAVPVIVTAKGFEHGTLALQSEIVATQWPKASTLVLSGPSFAVDVVAGRPTAVTLAGDQQQQVMALVTRLASDRFRLYASPDPKGVQLAGGLKNVYALACGAVEGARLGLSARSALIARAHVEMRRMIVSMGGDQVSATGLAGLGDLTLSCTSFQSRNYQFGLELGRGRRLDELLRMGLGLAEGVASAPVARDIAAGQKLDVPLIEAVNELLEGGLGIEEIVKALMTRPLKKEG